MVTVHSCVAVLGRYIRADTTLRSIKEEGDAVVEEEVLTPMGTLMSTITPWRGDGFLLRTWQCGVFQEYYFTQIKYSSIMSLLKLWEMN